MEAESPKDFAGQVLHRQDPTVVLQGGKETGTKVEKEEKIVEMPRLKRRILSVVRKAQDLPGIRKGGIGRSFLVQEAQGREGEQRGGGGTPFSG